MVVDGVKGRYGRLVRIKTVYRFALWRDGDAMIDMQVAHAGHG